MSKTFWEKLKKPFFVLAPMADVTDAPFRRIIAKYGKPDVFWTEFVSADGLVLAPKEGRKKLLKNFIFTEKERPIVAQIFSSKPENIRKAVEIVRKLKFDGVDINMGCPDRAVEKQGAGSALIKNPKLAREIIRSAKAGAKKMPVSVKTRIGYNKDELDKWLPEILAEEPAVVTIHARTRKEMSDFPARWEAVARAVKIRDELKSKTLIIGNGDAKDIEDAKKKVEETGADGVMFGRAIFGNPWLFSPLQMKRSGLLRPRCFDLNSEHPVYKARHPSLSKEGIRFKLLVLVEHTKLFEKLLKGAKSFSVMKKHFKAYVSGFDGASELRAKLMDTKSAREVEEIISDYLKNGLK